MGDNNDGGATGQPSGGQPLSTTAGATAGVGGALYRNPPNESGMDTDVTPSGTPGSVSESGSMAGEGVPPPGLAAHRAARLGGEDFRRELPPHQGAAVRVEAPLGLGANQTLPGGRVRRPLGDVSVGTAASLGPGDYDRGRKSGSYLPDPLEKSARIWNGDGTTLEDVIEWFESRAPSSVAGKDRMRLFSKYATLKARALLEEIPEILDDVNSWEEFLDCLRLHFPDRTKLRNLTTQEFEERSKKLLTGCWGKQEDVFTAGMEFGRLVKQYTREGSDSVRADETYYRWCHPLVVEGIIKWNKDRWRDEKGWDQQSLPSWKWLMKAHVDWYNPKNKMANAMLRRLRPELPSPAQLALEAADSKGEAMEKTVQKGWREERRGEKGSKEVEHSGDEMASLVRSMSELSLQHQTGGLQRRKELAERYQATVRAIQAIPGGREAIAYFPSTLEDPIGDGKAFTEACAEAFDVAETHGPDSAAYASQYALVAFNAPAGKDIKDYLPAPTYLARQGSNPVYPPKGNPALSYGVDSAPNSQGNSVAVERRAPTLGNRTSACYFCGQSGHMKQECSVRADCIKKGIITLHPYNWTHPRTGETAERMGDRWNLPSHPLNGARAVTTGGKYPSQILQEVMEEVKRKVNASRASTASQANAAESEELAAHMEESWAQEDERIKEYNPTASYAVAVDSFPDVQVSWGDGEDDFQAIMLRQWEAEDEALGLKGPGLEGGENVIVECGIHVVEVGLDSGMREDVTVHFVSQEEELFLHLFGGGEDDEGLVSEDSVNQALVNHLMTMESFAADKGKDRSAFRPTPYPPNPNRVQGVRAGDQSGVTTASRPFTRSQNSKGVVYPIGPAKPAPRPEVEVRPVAPAQRLPTRAPPGAGPVVKGESVGPSGAASAAPKRESSRPLIPNKFLPQNSLVSQGTDWREICRRIVTGRGTSDLSIQDLLVISPLLVSYLGGITRKLREGEDLNLLNRGAHTAAVRHVKTEGELGTEVYQSVSVEPSFGGVAVYETRGSLLDREEAPDSEGTCGVYLTSQYEPSIGEVGGWEGEGQHWCRSPLSVKTVLIPVSVNGYRCQAIVDDGSQINMVSKAFFDGLTQYVRVGIQSDLQYTVTGVHGEPVPLLGYFEADVKVGSMTTSHIFWVNQHAPQDKIFLGMPFIAKNLVEFTWYGYRRVMRMHSPNGTMELALHPDSGPVLTVAEPRVEGKPRRPLAMRLRNLRRLAGPPQIEDNIERELSYVCVAGELYLENPKVQAYMIEVESPEKITELEYTWTPRVRTRREIGEPEVEEVEEGELTPTPPAEETVSGTPKSLSALPNPKAPTAEGTFREFRTKDATEDDLWEQSQQTASRFAEADPIEQAVGTAVRFVDTDEQADDCLEFVVEDRRTRTRLLMGPTGRYYQSGADCSNAIVVEREDDFRRVHVYGAYKPVALKKRPVETTMKEEDKPLMMAPPNLMDDLPPVRPEGPSLTELQPGRRLTADRLEKVVFSMKDF